MPCAGFKVPGNMELVTVVMPEVLVMAGMATVAREGCDVAVFGRSASSVASAIRYILILHLKHVRNC